MKIWEKLREIELGKKCAKSQGQVEDSYRDQLAPFDISVTNLTLPYISHQLYTIKQNRISKKLKKGKTLQSHRAKGASQNQEIVREVGDCQPGSAPSQLSTADIYTVLVQYC